VYDLYKIELLYYMKFLLNDVYSKFLKDRNNDGILEENTIRSHHIYQSFFLKYEIFNLEDIGQNQSSSIFNY